MFYPDNEYLLVNEVEAHCLHHKACFCQCNFHFSHFGDLLLLPSAIYFPLYSKSIKKSEGIALFIFIINYLNFTLEILNSNFPSILYFFIPLLFPP